MEVKRITDPLAGEELLYVYPVMRPHVNAPYQQRVNMLPGRTLSDTALNVEQDHRSAHIARLGQMRSAGVISGLQAFMLQNDDTALQIPFEMVVRPGLGLAFNGEDVLLPYELRFLLEDIPVYATSAVLGSDPDHPDVPRQGTDHRARLGPSLVDLMANPDMPRAGVLVLRPVKLDTNPIDTSADPCEVDDRDLGFEDWREADAVQLVFYAWDSIPGLPMPDVALTGFSRWRNYLVHMIFEYENRLPVGNTTPWNALGIPLGLVGFSPDWQQAFVDRFAVVRQGGLPRPRTRLIGAGPVLWQARVQQIVEHIAEGTRAGVDVADLAGELRFVPPSGLLPREAITFGSLDGFVDTDPRGDNHFFPQDYVIQAAPIPMEQLDAALESSAGLAPFDFTVPDHVRILVPVPQALYEPELLVEETISPEFLAQIETLVAKRAEFLGLRADVYRRIAAISLVMDGTEAVFRDDGKLEEDEAITEVDYTDEETQTAYGVTITAIDADPAVLAVDDFRQRILDSYPKVVQVEDEETEELTDTTLGAVLLEEFGPEANVQDFVDYLKKIIDEADSLLDNSFLRLQAESYRVRKWMLGSEKAIRLATSPIAAEILDAATEVEYQKIQDVFLERVADLEKASGRGIVATPQAVAETTQPLFFASATTTRTGPSANVLMDTSSSTVFSTSRMISQPVTGTISSPSSPITGVFAGGVSVFDQPSTSVSPGSFVDWGTGGNVIRPGGIEDVISVGDVGVFLPGTGVDAPIIDTGGVVVDAFERATGYEAIQAFYGKSTYQISDQQLSILNPSRVSGKTYEFRTTTIAQRMINPVANEAKTAAGAGYFDALNALNRLGIYTDDLQVSGVPILEEVDDDGDETQYQYTKNEITKAVVRTTMPFAQMIRSTAYRGFSVFLQEPEPEDADEAIFFSESINVLDGMVATLRRVEGRVDDYRKVMADAQAVLAALFTNLRKADAGLKSIEDGLTQARHDVSVARALEQEELARIAAVNARRIAILENYVEFLAYHRPRLAPTITTEVPFHALDSAFEEEAVPACLEGDVAIPRELRAMVDMLRDVPLRWFRRTDKILGSIERLDTLHEIVNAARLRYGRLKAAPTFQYTRQTQITSAINRVLSAQQQSISRYTAQMVSSVPLQVADMSYKVARRQAEDIASMSDLLESRWQGSSVARQASEELHNIMEVASCLYVRFSRVNPSIRLTWVERLSQYDAPVMLSDLRVLPRWAEIDDEEQEDMQAMVSWLFGRINRAENAADDLMSDIVRMCLLIASHAPVSQIISGYVTEETPAVIGGLVKVNVNTTLVKVGMPVMLYQNNAVIAKAVVDDLSQSQAAVRIIESDSTVTKYLPEMKVHFGGNSGIPMNFLR